METPTFIWQNPEALNLLWLMLPCCFLAAYAAKWRRRAQGRFAAPGAFAALDPGAGRGVWGRAALEIAAIALTVVALARPAWNPVPEKRPAKGRAVVFLLDVSRSMLAGDLVPSRLERAKLAIADCLERVAGDRVALVAFAGTARLLCPLTVDYGFFRAALREAGPESVERGGTMLGDALRHADDLLFAKTRDGSGVDLVMLTDGGDVADGDASFAVEAAKRAGEKGMRLIVVGLGDEAQGGRVPVAAPGGGREFLKYRGREVWDRLHSALLRRMAAATPGGVYLNAGTGDFDLGEIYDTVIATAARHDLGERLTLRYQEAFPLFLAAALLLAGGGFVLGRRA